LALPPFFLNLPYRRGEAELVSLVLQRAQPHFQGQRLQETANIEFHPVARAIESLRQPTDIDVTSARKTRILKQRLNPGPLTGETTTERFASGPFAATFENLFR
jgi:hypothetical protein